MDVTSDWCLNCRANKTLVPDREPIADYSNHKTVIAMQADWTRPRNEIASFPKRHGRYGIPFNIVFELGALLGIALPELLTE